MPQYGQTQYGGGGGSSSSGGVGGGSYYGAQAPMSHQQGGAAGYSGGRAPSTFSDSSQNVHSVYSSYQQVCGP